MHLAKAVATRTPSPKATKMQKGTTSAAKKTDAKETETIARVEGAMNEAAAVEGLPIKKLLID